MSCWEFSLYTLGLMSTIVLGADCPYKECDCDGIYILCNYRDFKAMPEKCINNTRSFTSLDLDGNQITTIPAGSLPANLSGISLQDNPIATIDNTAFDESIYTLQEIYFSRVRFTQIPEAVFHLKAIKSLHIYQTNILVWNEGDMEQLGFTLETLNLDTVGLTSWPSWMTSMTNLTDLTISGCSISTIPGDALHMMTNKLTNLDLSNNGLTKLPESMAKLTNLNTLDLSYNRITDVTWLPQSTHLNTLYLGNNKITNGETVSNTLRLCANTITNFDIHNNSLTFIPELSFLRQISYLNFQFNHIVDANSGSFPANSTGLDFGNNFLSSIPTSINNLNQLTELSLNSNNIQFLQGTQIPTSVQMLDLSFNSISQLTQSSFPKNSSLFMLILNNNPLTTISPIAFTNIPHLSKLSLQSTKLTRLPLDIVSLTELYYLDVSNSKSLVCTCQEQSLRPWIQSVGSYSVRGNCGVTSVYFFFTALSPFCLQIL